MNYFIPINLFLFIFIHINYIQSKKGVRIDYTDRGYESLLSWGLNSSLIINDKIKLTLYNEEKQYISNSDIQKGETILDIPPELTLTINSSLSLFPSKNMNNAYINYIKEYKKSNRTLDDSSHIDQSFIAYLLYKANKTNTNENKIFYEHYKYLFYIFEEDLSHLPSFFTNEQIKIFLNTTSFGSLFELMNMYLMEEVNILEKKIFKENINLEEYFIFRFSLVQKSYNISNIMTVAPFIDFIKREFNANNINCKLVVSKGHIKIKATKNIEKGEILSMKPRKITNQYSFIFYGKTYEELLDYTSSYIIPIITPDLLSDEGIALDMDDNEEENKADLAWPNFFEIVLPTYKGVAEALKRDNSDYACYTMMLKYLKQIKESYKIIRYDDIEDAFLYERDSDNIKRIVRGEINFLDKKINELINIMANIKKVKIIRNKKGINNNGDKIIENKYDEKEFVKDL